MSLADLSSVGEGGPEEAARLLVDLMPEGWPTMEKALAEVRESLATERISRVALEGGRVVGWIGGLKLSYPGGVWELHPLVVRRDRQRRGIGKSLVGDLEERVQERGGRVIYLGSDDVRGETSLAGIDLYPDVLEQAARIRNVKGHPYEFYQRLGYALVGVLPDANGPGKPDIFMAKRIEPLPQE